MVILYIISGILVLILLVNWAIKGPKKDPEVPKNLPAHAISPEDVALFKTRKDDGKDKKSG